MKGTLLIAALMIMVTTAIHATGMNLLIKELKATKGWFRRFMRRHSHLKVSLVIITMFSLSVIEAMVWAATYLALNVVESVEDALYFSMVTYTTLGYGDIVLDERWRLLSGFEAANGIIMFGWTTAIVMFVVQHVYFGKGLDP